MTLRRLAPVAATLVVLSAALFAFHDKIALDQLLARLAASDISSLALSIPLFLIAAAGAVWRNKFIIERGTRAKMSFKYLFLLSNFSYALGYLAPISAAAEALRLGAIKQHLSITYGKSLRLVVIDKIIAFSGIALFSLSFIPLKLKFGLNPILVWTECLLLVGFFVIAPILTQVSSLAMAKIPGLWKLAAAVREDGQFILDNFSAPRDLATFVICSFLAVGGFAAGATLVASAEHLDNLALIFAISPTVLLVQNMPLFYAGFGAREAALLFLLKDNSVDDPNLVLGFSLVLGVMLFLSTIPAAFKFLIEIMR